MKRLICIALAFWMVSGCSKNEKPVVPSNAPTTTLEPVSVGGKAGGGVTGGLNKKIPGK